MSAGGLWGYGKDSAAPPDFILPIAWKVILLATLHTLLDICATQMWSWKERRKERLRGIACIEYLPSRKSDEPPASIDLNSSVQFLWILWTLRECHGSLLSSQGRKPRLRNRVAHDSKSVSSRAGTWTLIFCLLHGPMENYHMGWGRAAASLKAGSEKLVNVFLPRYKYQCWMKVNECISV